MLLDFYAGSHGHFLEYIINRYVFRGTQVNNLFTALGTSHGVYSNPEYMNNRTIIADHYSEFNIDVPEPAKVVRITINSDMGRMVYQINVNCRAGEIPVEKKLEIVPDEITQNPARLRESFYTKFDIEELGYNMPTKWKWDNADVFEFPMESLFNIVDLYRALKLFAEFAEHSFNPDPTLVEIWNEFIYRNHGVQSWRNCDDLLAKALANENYRFNCTVYEQSLLNWMIKESIGLCDGPLFENIDYPTNTHQIYRLIQDYIDNFDQRF